MRISLIILNIFCFNYLEAFISVYYLYIFAKKNVLIDFNIKKHLPTIFFLGLVNYIFQIFVYRFDDALFEVVYNLFDMFVIMPMLLGIYYYKYFKKSDTMNALDVLVVYSSNLLYIMTLFFCIWILKFPVSIKGTDFLFQILSNVIIKILQLIIMYGVDKIV